ncbi:MAG: serine/threonine-protein kinase [bacterium]
MNSDHDNSTLPLGDVVPGPASGLMDNSLKGSSVGRYVLIEQVGSGGMGVVYSAYDPQLDRKVAIKFLHHKFVGNNKDTELQQRLLAEARSLAKLAHPNVVTIYDSGIYAKQVYIATEFLSGPTLNRLDKSLSDNWESLLKLYIEAGKGLNAAHEAGLVHRDFKPGNIMLDQSGRAKVMDFGLAKQLDDQAETAPFTHEYFTSEALSPDSWSSPESYSGVIMGTPAYMSPEQIQGYPATELSDQFSYCVALFEALFKTKPFKARTPQSALDKIKKGAAHKIPKNSSIPGNVQKIIFKGLSFDPEQRYPSMRALLDALHAAREKPPRYKYFAAITLAILIGSVLFIRQEQADLCAFDDDPVNELWSPQAQSQVKSAFLSTNKSFATESWGLVNDKILGYLSKWKQKRVQACQLTHVQGSQSEELLDLQMLCLNHNKDSLKALIAVLSKADDTIVSRSTRAVAELPALSSCDNPKSLLERLPLPNNESQQKLIQQQEQYILTSKALYDAGKYQQSVDILDQVTPKSMAIYPPLKASYLYRKGRAQERLSQLEQSEKNLEAATFWATRSRDYPLAVQSATGLANATGYVGEHTERGKNWLVRAKSLLDETDDPLLEATFYSVSASIYQVANEHDKELIAIQKAVELRRRYLPKDSIYLGFALNNLANAWRYQNRVDKAIPYLKEAQQIFSSALGQYHPLNVILLGNLGGAYQELGITDKAIKTQNQALKVAKKTYGENHQETAAILINLSVLALDKKNTEQCLNYAHAATVSIDNSIGPDNPYVLESIAMESECLARSEQYPELLQKTEQGLQRIKPENSGKIDRAKLLYFNTLARFKLGESNLTMISALKEAITLTSDVGVYMDEVKSDCQSLLSQIEIKLAKPPKEL